MGRPALTTCPPDAIIQQEGGKGFGAMSPAARSGKTGLSVKKSRSHAPLQPASEPFHLSPGDLLRVFDGSPVSIWLEDFSHIKTRLDELRASGVADFRGYLKRHPEEVISLAQAVRILAVNEATLELYEAVSKKALQRGLGLVFDKASYDVFREELISLANGKKEFGGEAVTKSLKGNARHVLLKLIVPADYADTMSRVIVFLVDVTGLKASQRELAESEEKYRTVVECAPDALVVSDADSGIVLEANRMAGRLFGLPHDKIVGMHFTQLLPREGSGPAGRTFKDSAADGRWVSRDMIVGRENGEKTAVSVRTCLAAIRGRSCVLTILQESDRETGARPGPAGSGEPVRVSPLIDDELRRLSRRELDIIRLIAAGLTNGQIAKRLFISIKTVDTHRARIMEKLGFHKTADIVRFAIYSGLCEAKR
jgi:PAS domain S-box-containing protein